MKIWIYISIWVVLSLVGAISTRSNILYWLLGLIAGKALIRVFLIISLAIILFIVIYLLIIYGLFGILVS